MKSIALLSIYYGQFTDIGSEKKGNVNITLDKVLLNGASGGVGTFAVQIAKSVGAEVTAVCITMNLDLARPIGAMRETPT